MREPDARQASETEDRSVPKMKTKSALKRRVKVTGTGKLVRFKAGRRHLMVSKNAKKRRQARGAHLIEGGIAKNYLELLRPGL